MLSAATYRAPFGMLTVVLIVALAIYSRSTDGKPSEQMKAAAAGQGRAGVHLS